MTQCRPTAAHVQPSCRPAASQPPTVIRRSVIGPWAHFTQPQIAAGSPGDFTLFNVMPAATHLRVCQCVTSTLCSYFVHPFQSFRVATFPERLDSHPRGARFSLAHPMGEGRGEGKRASESGICFRMSPKERGLQSASLEPGQNRGERTKVRVPI